MSGPTVVVDWAPEGWTHIGGPGMHLLIGLHEEDEQTLHASDAADGGDLDDVLEVLTAGGMRRARHFVGVHTGDTTRIVAFGPVAAVVTLADGSEHDVRATSARVWADLDLADAPERIVLRVLDESESEQPAPLQTLTSAGPVALPAPVTPAAPAAATGEPARQDGSPSRGDGDSTVAADDADATGAPAEPGPASVPPTPAPADRADRDDQADEPDGRAGGADATPPPAVPTFGSPAAAEPGRAASSWGRSWARRDEPAAGTEEPTLVEAPPEVAQPAAVPLTSPTVHGRSVVESSGEADLPVAQGDSAASDDIGPSAGANHSVAQAGPLSAATPALRSWASARPAVPVRGAGSPGPDVPAAAAQTETPSPPSAAAVTSADPVAPQASSAATPPTSTTRVAPAAPTAPEPVFEVPVSPAPATGPAPSPQAADAAPVADDLPAADTGRDFESTWASRPEAPEEPKPAAANATPRPAAPAPPSAQDPVGPPDGSDAGDDAPPTAPSYDYLFGHTTAVDEHRRVLAELTKVDQGDDHHDDHPDDHPDDHVGGPESAGTPDATAAAPAVADAAPAPVTNPVPEAPVAAPQPVPGSSGGLISAVPWATSSPTPPTAPAAPTAPTATEAPVDTPTFSGRHTPPPAPSLLPPVITPPPGVRAPQATPLISTGPPSTSAASDPSAGHPAPTAPPGQPVPSAGPGHAAPHDTPRFEQHHTPRLAAATEDLDELDEAEQTVDRSALLEARHAAQLANPTGPSVLAVLCASGHPTPPHGDACRVCGASIPPQEPFAMPRPPLGVLRLSTGDVVTLDRSVLLGRSPKLDDGVAATDRPHVVKVPSPERDVSRNHVEVLLEGWHVLVRDLGTTNGTTMALPGEAPIRLRANDQQVLEPGSVVSMADEVSFTFEAAL